MTSSTTKSSNRGRIALGVVAAVLVAGMAEVASAQGAQRPVRRSFQENAPGVGDMMPNLTVYDRDGAEHRLGDLLGERYTVLILGCLT